MPFLQHRNFLRNVLLADAITCVVSGLLMTLAPAPLANLTGLPANLIAASGASLLPVAAFITFVATRDPVWPAGTWIVIIGNIGWVAGCLVLLWGGSVNPTVFGAVFLLAQAIAVAGLTCLEYLGLVHRPAVA